MNPDGLMTNFTKINKLSLQFVLLFSLITSQLFLINSNIARASDPTLLKEIDVENDSFRDLKWGVHISDCPDMVYGSHKQTTGGNVKLYRRNNDSLVLDNKIKLSKIEYGFLNSKLLFVALKTSDPDNKKAFKEIVILRFGDDQKSELSGNLYWVKQNTNIIFQANSSSKDSVLMLVSMKGLTSNYNR